MKYEEFLKTKIELAAESGFDIDPEEIAPILKPHQRMLFSLMIVLL